MARRPCQPSLYKNALTPEGFYSSGVSASEPKKDGLTRSKAFVRRRFIYAAGKKRLSSGFAFYWEAPDFSFQNSYRAALHKFRKSGPSPLTRKKLKSRTVPIFADSANPGRSGLSIVSQRRLRAGERRNKTSAACIDQSQKSSIIRQSLSRSSSTVIPSETEAPSEVRQLPLSLGYTVQNS